MGNDSKFFDDLETRPPELREQELFRLLPELLAKAKSTSESWEKHLSEVDVGEIKSRADLTKIPIFRKSDLMSKQSSIPPFGGFVVGEKAEFTRYYMSPGPIWEPEGIGSDPWNCGRALFAANFRRGDLVHNTFSYHMTPGGFMIDSGAISLGCVVFPAGTGNTELQLQAIKDLRPTAYTGTPDYLKVLLDSGNAENLDLTCIKKAAVSGGALFPSLRQEYEEQGISIKQSYATGDLGIIAYESEAKDGLIVNENYLVEIVKPGTGTPVQIDEVGELVVTSFNSVYPLIRFATGDLSAIMDGNSPCGRTNVRIKGWMGRADQRTKVKGMFVDPAQIERVINQYEDISKARLAVTRAEEQDKMTLLVETSESNQEYSLRIADTLREITKLKGDVELVEIGSLPNDGKVISDERNYE